MKFYSLSSADGIPLLSLRYLVLFSENRHFFTDHSCEAVMKSADSWPRLVMQVRRKMLPRTGTDSRLAGGLRGCSSSLGPPLPITMANTVTKKMSQIRNCRSAMVVFTWTHTARSHVFHCEIFN